MQKLPEDIHETLCRPFPIARPQSPKNTHPWRPMDNQEKRALFDMKWGLLHEPLPNTFFRLTRTNAPRSPAIKLGKRPCLGEFRP